MAADRSVANARVDLARKTFARESSLFTQGVTPRQEMEAAQSALAVAQSEAQRASLVANAAHVSADGKSVSVVSPIAGRITAQTAMLGGFVQPQTELFRVAGAGSLLVEASLPAADVKRVAIGDKATIIAAGGTPVAAMVRSVTPTVSGSLAEWTPASAPALASAAAERDVFSAQVRLEQKRGMPDIGVSVGMRRFGWSSEKAATIGVSASIPLFDRNQAGVEAARERAAGAALRVEAARLEAAALHRSSIAQVQASDKRLQAALQGELAAADAYRLGRVGYDAGKTALLELLAIRRAWSDATALTIEARLGRVRALATLSLAEGRNVFGEAP